MLNQNEFLNEKDIISESIKVDMSEYLSNDEDENKLKHKYLGKENKSSDLNTIRTNKIKAVLIRLL